MKAWFVFFFVIWCFLALIAASYMVGCASNPQSGAGTVATKPTEHPVPPSLKGLSVWLDIFAVIAVPIIVGGLVSYFLMPEAHKLSSFLAIGGASLFGVSVLLRVSLWLVPWVAGSLGGLALLALVYELYVKISKNKNVPDLLNLGNSASNTGLTAPA